MSISTTEARGFAEALGDMARAVKSFPGMSFYADAMRKSYELINSLCDVVEGKEKGRERETFPPAPPIERKGSQEKAAAATATRARVRGKFSPPTKEDVYNYADGKKIPHEFADYWYQCMETNYNPPWFDEESQKFIKAWRRSLIAYWNHAEGDKEWHRYCVKAETKPARKINLKVLGGV